MKYSIDSNEYACSDEAKISDCNVLAMRERGDLRKERNPNNHCGKKSNNEKPHANIVRFRNRLSRRQVTFWKDASQSYCASRENFWESLSAHADLLKRMDECAEEQNLFIIKRRRGFGLLPR
jgi:hypothetical protein